MRFYLGTHHVQWVKRARVPLLISWRWLAHRQSYPVAEVPWALDSGGFTHLQEHGKWTITPERYIEGCHKIIDGMGEPDWIAPQDWMCEPVMIGHTGLSIPEHQARTVENFVTLRSLAPELPIIPVIQGYAIDDYLRCVELYRSNGVDLTTFDLIGLGSVCRRQDTEQATQIITALQPLRLHGFGVKTSGLARYRHLIESADSAAWSVRGRWEARERWAAAGYPRPYHPRCSHGVNYAHCLDCAHIWYDALRIDRPVSDYPPEPSIMYMPPSGWRNTLR